MSTWKNNILILLLLWHIVLICSLTCAFFRMRAHAGLSPAFYLPLLTPIDGKIILLSAFS
jgi:hypothetical protein